MNRRPLAFRAEASEEFLEAVDWYQGQRSGLGRRFIDAVDKTLDAIADNPRLYQLVYRDVRRAVVTRFPYGVFFQVLEDRVRVLSISHLARDPEHWQRRQ